MTKDEKELILEETYADTMVFAKTFFPDHFDRPFDVLHRAIIEAMEGPEQFIAIAAPRGIGKTTNANLLIPSKHILFNDSSYIVPVSATSGLALQQSENLKYALTQNPLVHEIFGDIKADIFNKEMYAFNVGGHEVCIMPRGAQQQIRGMLWRGKRPDLIIVDDLESAEGVMSETRRYDLKEWFFADLMNCTDPGKRNWKIIVVGTILHQSSLLVELLKSPMWKSIKLSICDDDYKTLAPYSMPQDVLDQKIELFRDQGKLDTFFREFMNNPVPQANAAFKQEFFRDYDEAEIDFKPSKYEHIVIVDPAKTVKLNSAESAIVCIACDMENNCFFVRDVVAYKMHPDELYTECVDMVRKFDVSAIGVEVTSLHEFITWPLMNEFIRRGVAVELIELHARGGSLGSEKGKILRIRSLVSLYRDGLIFHNKACCRQLEQQLMTFPRPERWDIMDALGYLPEMLEKGERYMQYGSDPEYDDSAEKVEREYADLGYDEEEEPLEYYSMV